MTFIFGFVTGAFVAFILCFIWAFLAMAGGAE